MPFAPQTRGIGLWHICALLVAGVLVAMMYKGEGYPEKDAVDGKNMTARQHIASLNLLGQAVPQEMRHTIALKDNCTLEFSSLRRRPEGNAFDVPLLSMEVSSRTDRDTGLTFVMVGSPDGPDAPPHEVYESDRWYEAISYRSHLGQLMRLCVKTLRQATPDSTDP